MEICKARKNGTQGLRPVLRQKKKPPHYVHAAAVIIDRRRVLLAQRPQDGLLGGMWEFPNGRIAVDPAKELAKVVKSDYGAQVKRKEALGSIQHAYTHFKVTVFAFYCDCKLIPKNKNMKWVRLAELDDYPMGKVDRQIAQKIK
jgi:A/G-specific adenine glycosylase